MFQERVGVGMGVGVGVEVGVGGELDLYIDQPDFYFNLS